MPNRPVPPPSRRPAAPPPGYAAVPTVHPRQWENHAVFRETFLATLDDEEAVAAFRVFAKAQYAMALEYGPPWYGTPADATAHGLRAITADLRFLQGYLTHVGNLEQSALDQGLITPRNERWLRFAGRMSEKLRAIADEIEQELGAGLAEKDED